MRLIQFRVLIDVYFVVTFVNIKEYDFEFEGDFSYPPNLINLFNNHFQCFIIHGIQI